MSSRLLPPAVLLLACAPGSLPAAPPVLVPEAPRPAAPAPAAQSARPPGPSTVRFDPVSTRAGQARIDWTSLVVTSTAEAKPVAGLGADRMVLEDQADARLGPDMLQAAARVRIDTDTTAGDLLRSGSALGRQLDRETGVAWHVVEARYHAGGGVEVDGELDLATWLRPVVTDRASRSTAPAGERSTYTGFVVDGRGVSAEGALAPRILGPDGAVLYDAGMLAQAAARHRTPVQYVTDPADPRGVARSGTTPLVVRAADARDGVDLVLGPDDAARFVTVARDARLLADGSVVLVLDASP